MPDLLDAVDTTIEQNLQACLSLRKNSKPYIGRCYYCDEPIDRGHFCTTECREDFELHEFAASQRVVTHR